MNGADFIVDFLIKKENVKYVFTYAGGTDAPLLNSMHNKIFYIPTRHEENAALAAVGYSLTAETLGVAMAMSGPGATNLTTGIADAWFDSVPVLFLTGQVTRSTYKFDNPSRQMGYQETDIVSIVKSITKKAKMITDIRELPEIFTKYVEEARSGRPGPVLIDVPFDILKDGQIDEQAWPEFSKPKLKINDDVIKIFIDRVLASKRALIVAGGGVNNSKSKDLLIKLSERLQIPVVTSLNGKSSFPNEHPFYFGFIGAYGNRYANIAMANSDLLIALGSRLDSRQTGDTRSFAREAFKIHVDIDKNELNNNIKSDLIINADVNDFMESIFSYLSKGPGIRCRTDVNDKWVEYFNGLKKEFDVVTDVKGTNKNVHPKKFLQELSKYNNEDTVYLADVGNNQMFAAQSLIVKKNQKFLVSGGLGTMGFALPASVGAYFAAPKSHIVAITGDGGFQMALQELQTLKHFNIPVKIIVLNNQILGLMKVFQDEIYNGVHPATVDGYSAPDIGKIANAFGFKFKRVDTTEEALDFIPEFFSTKESLILEATIHEDWTCYPKMKRGYPIEYAVPAIPDELLAKYMLIPMFTSKNPIQTSGR